MLALTRQVPTLLGAVACSLAVFWTQPGHAADPSMIVLKANGVSFKPGDKVTPTTLVKLADGQSLSVIAADGRIIAIKGPYEGALQQATGAKATSITDVLSPLVNQAKSETSTAGVVRGGGPGAPPSVDPWVIDSTKNADFCIFQNSSYDIWRPDGMMPETISLAPGSGGSAAQIRFPSGAMRAPIPDSFNFEDGKKYKVSRGSSTIEVTVHVVPDSVPSEDRVTAAWLVQENCQTQAKALLKRL